MNTYETNKMKNRIRIEEFNDILHNFKAEGFVLLILCY